MPNQLKFLDLTGTQYLVQKIKGEIPSDSYINTLITNKLSEYRDDIVTICSELPSEGEAGILYLVPDTNAESNNVYIMYAWEVVDDTTNPKTYDFVQMGAATFTITVDTTVTEDSQNPVSGGAVFTALSGKASSSHTHGNITNDGKLSTASKVVVTDSNKVISVSSVTAEELGYLSGVTSSIQTQLSGKANSSHTHTVSDITDLEAISNAEIDALFTGSNS